MRATLAYLFTCLCIAHVLKITFNTYRKEIQEKKNPAYNIVNLSG